MTHYTTETIPAREYKRATHITCDFCGTASQQADGWGKHSHDIDEITLSRRKGSNWPDGGDTETTSADLCPACFSDRLLPWLAAQGVKLAVESHDW